MHLLDERGQFFLAEILAELPSILCAELPDGGARVPAEHIEIRILAELRPEFAGEKLQRIETDLHREQPEKVETLFRGTVMRTLLPRAQRASIGENEMLEIGANLPIRRRIALTYVNQTGAG